MGGLVDYGYDAMSVKQFNSVYSQSLHHVHPPTGQVSWSYSHI